MKDPVARATEKFKTPGPYLGQIASGKRVGVQNGKYPNRDM